MGGGMGAERTPARPAPAGARKRECWILAGAKLSNTGVGRPAARAGQAAASLIGRQSKQGAAAMLITFKSRATVDVTMLENLAQFLLAIVGKRLGERGVISRDELPAAISKLEAAIAEDKQNRAEHDGHFHEDEEGHEPHELPIGLAQRAFPFLDMLREAHKENSDVMWGV
jgi:Domain of unknown function (DUF1840)